MPKWIYPTPGSKLPNPNAPKSNLPGGGKSSGGRGRGQGGGVQIYNGLTDYYHKESSVSNVQSITVTITNLPNVGDILIGAVAHYYASTVLIPAGWSFKGYANTVNGLGAHNLSVFYKISDGTETSVVFDQQAASSTMIGAVAVFRDYDGTVRNFHTVAESVSGGFDVVAGDHEVPFADSLGVVFAAASTNTGNVGTCTVTGSGWVEKLDNNTGSSPNGKRHLVLAVCPTNSNLGVSTYTWTTGSEDRSSASMWLRRNGKVPSGDTDPYFSSVVLLADFEYDGSSVYTNLANRGNGSLGFIKSNVSLSSTLPKFGTYSLRAATNGGTRTNTHSDFTIGTNDFTIEFWFKVATTAGSWTICDMRKDSSQGTSVRPTIKIDASGGIFLMVNGVNVITGAANSIIDNTWQHIALSRVSGETRLFVDGTQVGSTYADTNSYLSDSVIYLGSYPSGGATNANYDEFRFSNGAVGAGAGRYAANFTPPTTVYPRK